MSFRQPNEALRQSMNRLIDKFDYLTENDADYEVNIENDTGYIRLFGVKKSDVNDCKDLMSEGFENITLHIEEDNSTYIVTAEFEKLP